MLPCKQWTFKSKPGIQLFISRFFIFKSAPGFQIWGSNLRFTSYFNSSFNLFLINCWLFVFGFLQNSAVKPRFWTFFSVNYCFFLSASSDLEFSFSNTGSDLELSFSNPGLFEFQVWNKPGIEKLNSRSTLISPISWIQF